MLLVRLLPAAWISNSFVRIMLRDIEGPGASGKPTLYNYLKIYSNNGQCNEAAIHVFLF